MTEFSTARVSRSCGWCHEMVPLHQGRPTYCPNCGHRADVSRLLCDCLRCSGMLSGPVVVLNAAAKQSLWDGSLPADWDPDELVEELRPVDPATGKPLPDKGILGDQAGEK